MEGIKTWRFFIAPQTHIRSTQAENWMFAEGIDDEYLLRFGLKKYNERIAKGSKNPGTPKNYYNRKKRLQKYWDYKRALRTEAELQKFIMPNQNIWLCFFVGMPKSWAKAKKKEKNFTLSQDKPDVDNFAKAAFDSLMGEDKAISDFRATKFYYEGSGYIEISVGQLPPAIGYQKYWDYRKDDKIK